MLLDRLKAYIQDPPPDLAIEISEAGLAGARLGAKTEIGFAPLKPGALAVSPVQENVVDPDEFSRAVRTLAGAEHGRKHRDLALIVPDYCARIAVLDFDSFPGDAKEQASLIRFRLKRSVPFDAESAALSYWPEPGASGKKVDVLVAMAPLEIISRYEAPFRAAGMNPGLVVPSSLAAMELAPDGGVSVIAKMSGRVLTVVARAAGAPKLVRCLELPAPDLDEVAAVLAPTFVYLEDNLGKPEKLYLCGFGAQTDEAARRFGEDLGAEVEPVRSPLGVPGESDAGLLGYLRSIARDN